MATDSASPPHDRLRRLWQVPTFLVGLGCLVAVWQAGDRLRPSAADRYQRVLYALRPAVDRWPADIDRIHEALRRLPNAPPPDDLRSEVKFLTGSAFVALAEASPSPAESAEFWGMALRELEAVTEKDLAGGDRKKLRYRLARTWANTPSADTERTIKALSESLQSGDDPSEGYRLLADLHLKSTPPDPAKARECLQDYLKHANVRADARALNGARIRLAELHAQLGEADEARRVLDRVGAEAPPEILATARLMTAELRIAARDWAGAAKVLEQVRDMRGANDDQRARAQRHLGEAYAKLDRPADAAAALATLTNVKLPGPDAKAAGFRMAALKVQDPSASIKDVVVALEESLAKADPDSVRKQVPPAEAKQICEQVHQRARLAGDYSMAVRVAKAYGAVAEQGDHHRLVADAYEAWAESLAADPARADDRRDHLKAAATAWAAAAEVAVMPDAQTDLIRKSATIYLKAGEKLRAVAALAKAASRMSAYPADRAGSAWLELGDAFLVAGDRPQALAALQTAATRTGPDQLKARVRLAALAVEFEADKLAEVVPLLEQVADRPADPKDRATHEEASFLLGEALMVQMDYPKAESRLRAAIDAYPQSPRCHVARVRLGKICRYRAVREARKIEAAKAALAQISSERLETRQPKLKVTEQIAIEDRIVATRKTYEAFLVAAFEAFKAAEDNLADAASADQALLRQASFMAADCAFWLGQHENSATRYEKLVVRHKGTVLELDALHDLHRTCLNAAAVAQEQKDFSGESRWARRATEAYQRVKERLPVVPASEFDDSGDRRTRAAWDRWLTENAPASTFAEPTARGRE